MKSKDLTKNAAKSSSPLKNLRPSATPFPLKLPRPNATKRKPWQDCLPCRTFSTEIKALDAELIAIDEQLVQSSPSCQILPTILSQSEQMKRIMLKFAVGTRGLDFKPKAHWDGGENLDILDWEREQKSQVPVSSLQGLGCLFGTCLYNFMWTSTWQKATKRSFHPISSTMIPCLALANIQNSRKTLLSWQTPTFVPHPDSWSTFDQLLPWWNFDGKDLPINFYSHESILRSEAGSAGRDTSWSLSASTTPQGRDGLLPTRAVQWRTENDSQRRKHPAKLPSIVFGFLWHGLPQRLRTANATHSQHPPALPGLTAQTRHRNGVMRRQTPYPSTAPGPPPVAWPQPTAALHHPSPALCCLAAARQQFMLCIKEYHPWIICTMVKGTFDGCHLILTNIIFLTAYIISYPLPDVEESKKWRTRHGHSEEIRSTKFVIGAQNAEPLSQMKEEFEPPQSNSSLSNQKHQNILPDWNQI